MEMKIGVVVADIDEFLPLKEAVSVYGAQECDYFGRLAVTFEFEGFKVLCVHCGIGKVNAAAATMYLVNSGCLKVSKTIKGLILFPPISRLYAIILCNP